MSDLVFIDVVSDCKVEFGNFHAGEIRKVTPEQAGALIGNGWAVKSESAAIATNATADTPEPVTLEVQNAGLGVKAEDINNG